jgi:uncharacterized protein (UPF0261 family)
MMPSVIFIATYDTKGEESEYIKQRIIESGANCVTIDVGVGKKPLHKPDVSLEDLCSEGGITADEIRSMPRGEAVAMASELSTAYVKKQYEKGQLDAVIGIGGAGGTQIVTQAMRELPFGLPKLMLSTLASGNTRWYIKETDINIIPSIVDVAGLNSISMLVFDRFAKTAAAQAKWYKKGQGAYEKSLMDPSAFRIAQTMYGTTTAGVTDARIELEKNSYETIVFHASGAGGMSMEGFIRQGIIHALLDMTLAEIGAHIVGGLHDAGPLRMSAAVEMGIPYVVVPGAADTIVLPPMSDLQDRFKSGRVLNFHNPTMTTMRTNVEENIAIGNFICEKLAPCKKPVVVLLPKGGLSSIDKPGQVFYNPEANEALFGTLKQGLKGTNVQIIEDDRHLYDEGFGKLAAQTIMDLIKQY